MKNLNSSFFILHSSFSPMFIEQNYPLLSHNTFGIEAATRWFISYDNEDELRKILSDEYFLSQPVLHIGAGSNLLFLSDYEGIILHSRISSIELISEDDHFVELRVGAGMTWDDLVIYTVGKGWGGIENLSNIPGEVGASAVQNIGAYGCEAKDVIVEVTAYDMQTGEKHLFGNKDCEFGYRHSIFKGKWKGRFIVTHVTFRFSKQPQFSLEYGNLKQVLDGKEINLQTVRDAVITVRASKLPDPEVLGNAGSFFMNPFVSRSQYELLKEEYPDIPSYPVSENSVKIPAAWLIDHCGLKGFQQGNAAVHDKQPLVLVNKGGATGKEIASLAEKVREQVKAKFNIEINPEVAYIG